MKKHVFLILYCWLFLTIPCTHSQTNYFVGTLTGKESITDGKVTLLLYEDSSNKYGRLFVKEPDSIINCSLAKDGTFHIKFSPPSSLFYMALKVYSGEKELTDLRKDFLLNPYLCEQGDSIYLEINRTRKSAIFTGQGADKLNCQYLLNHLKNSREIQGPYYFMPPFNKVQPFEAREKVYLADLSYRTTIIEQYQGIVSQRILNRIRYDAITLSKYQFADFMVNNYSILGENVKKSLNDFFYGNDTKSILLSEDNTLVEAPVYADFLLMKNDLKYRIIHNVSTRFVTDKKHYFDWMYQNLKTNYNGALRDRLITTWFINSAKQYFSHQMNVLNEVTEFIGQESYRNMLHKHTQFETIYPFHFIDKLGRVHTPEDYKGKIMVMDFWFTGCSGCRMIPPVLSKIMEKFKHRNDVIFLSINVEPSKTSWKKSLESGLYTIPGQIHLKTRGDGRIDPFIMHYKIQGYPYTMLIGKNGKMLSMSPDDPRSDNGSDIISHINQALGTE